MDWTGAQKKRLRQALMDAYRDVVELEIFVADELDGKLKEISPSENLKTVTFKLVDWAESQGRLEELKEALLLENPRFASQFEESLTEEKAGAERRLIGTEALGLVSVWGGRGVLLADLPGELDGRGRTIAILGQGGMGKSAIATKLVEAAGIDPVTGDFGDDRPLKRAIVSKITGHRINPRRLHQLCGDRTFP
ncbi:MAG: effector-associated domain EAD1-containing protein, partial [Cyanobacteria bacterium P01_C01_bin.89]